MAILTTKNHSSHIYLCLLSFLLVSQCDVATIWVDTEWPSKASNTVAKWYLQIDEYMINKEKKIQV